MSSIPKAPKGAAPTPAPATRAVAVQPFSNSGVAMFSGGLLAQLAGHAKDVAATEKVQSGAMSLRSGVMQWQGKPVPGNRMNVIVLATSYENTYYPKAFDPNNISSPVCFAQSLADGDLAPHANSVDKQHPSCKGCWAHEWSSDPKGGKGKACKQVRKLALIPAYEDEDEIATAEMATLRVPVMSVRNWSGYASERATVDGLPFFVFSTEISVVPDPRSQFQVHFAKVGVLPSEEVVAAVMARIKQAEQLLLTPYDPAKEEEEAPAAPVGGRKPAKY
jgi:hypothetical protein